MAGKTLAVIPLATVDERLVTVGIQDGAVDGIAKVVQAAIFLLATEQGTMRHLPALGANPSKKIQQVSVADISQVQEVLNETAFLIGRQLELLFPPETSDPSEQVNSLVIEFEDYDLGSRMVTAVMRLDTAFGENAAYPVTFSHSV